MVSSVLASSSRADSGLCGILFLLLFGCFVSPVMAVGLNVGSQNFRIIDELCDQQPISGAYSDTGLQVLSGSNSLIAFASSMVSLPRFFSYITPFWLMSKVVMPVSPYFSGWATMAKPPVIFPFTT